MLVDVATMRQMEARTIELGTSGKILMERAGAGIAQELAARWPEARRRGVLILAGSGNNGGDGFVVARLLKSGGVPVWVLLVGATSEIKGDARAAFLRWRRAGGRTQLISGPAASKRVDRAFAASGIVLDALFGTGLSRPIKGTAAWLLSRAHDLLKRSVTPPVCIAVDLPSGLDGDSGEPLGEVLRAQATLTLGAVKKGLAVPAARPFVGQVVAIDIGLAPEAFSEAGALPHLSCADSLQGVLSPRAASANKGNHGHLLLVGGAPGKSGAIVLAARAALRGGAGLVSVACPRASWPIVASSGAEWMTECFDDFSAGQMQPFLLGRSAVVVGPGLGTTRDAGRLVRWLARTAAVPLLLDADALNLLAPLRGRIGQGNIVVTPHPGEMARLCGLKVAAVQKDREGLARRMAARWGATVVLKGAATVVAAADGRLAVNGSGGPILAVGGTGDVLAGIIGALLAQGLDGFEAARVGAWAHGRAADRLALRLGDRGLLASELADELPLALREIIAAGG